MKHPNLSAEKRAAAIQQVEKGARLKKWLSACIVIGIILLMLAIVID